MIHAIVGPLKAAVENIALFTTGTDTRTAGVVIPVTRKVGDKRLTFPVSCDVTGATCVEQGRYLELLPNDQFRAVIYFEQRSDVRFVGYLDAKDKLMRFDADVRLVGWLNLKKMGLTDCSITARVVMGIIKALTTTRGETDRNSGRLLITDGNYTNAAVEVVPVRQVRQDKSIFNRYTIPEDQLLYPWDYFALDLRCSLIVGRECFAEVTDDVEILC